MHIPPARLLAALVLTAVLTGTATACGSGGSSPTGSVDTGTAGTPSMSSSGAVSSSIPATHPTEFNPPGDIPDNAVFVDHVAAGSNVHFSVPEGWAQATQGGTTTFTDHFNGVAVEVVRAAQAPTKATAQQVDVPQLSQGSSQFRLTGVDTVTRKGGTAIRIRYSLDSPPDPVTGKVVRDAVERYEFWHAGQEAILTLSGPQNADNVDPWRTVSDSVSWR